MPLASRTKLGPYEILSPLGAGGMGEVYRARDTRLDREVAIKVLPAHLTKNAEFRQRFEREAKTISQITHTHICTLFDVGHENGVDYLVMELLEGETLAQRLVKGAMPIEQVLRYGVEIAAALDAAHRKGVIHRDLKPGNIMLTKSGAKLLDFGLAKSSTILDSDPTAVTVSQPLTSKGTILGTFQYMAPEQLEGEEADARTDIFALGMVLYEMATGKPAFEGTSRASLIAAIMSSQPQPISNIQPMTPPALDQLVRNCLAKDPEERIQTAHDVRLQLQWISAPGSQVAFSMPSMRPQKTRERFWIFATLLLLAVSLALAVVRPKTEGVTPHKIWSAVPLPEKVSVATIGDLAGPAVISPDGTMLAFVAKSADVQELWVRPLSSPSARALHGTEDATFPFWSPDGRSIGYFAKEKLYIVGVNGAPPISICDANGGRGGTWNRNGVILFAPEYRSGIYRVAATGGKPEPVTKIDESKHTSHRWPAFCPDGSHFLFLAVAHGAAETESNAIYLGSLDGSKPRLVMHGSANALPVGDRIIYLRDNALMASAFDMQSAKTTGEPAVIATGVMYDVTIWRAAFSVSQQGELVFHSGTANGDIQMLKRDRSGKDLAAIGDTANVGGMRLSPDARRIAVDVAGVETDIWVYDLARNFRTRLTFGEGANVASAWSPDGQFIIYASLYLARKDATHRISRRPASGGEAEVLFTSNIETWPTDCSPDGKYLLVAQGKYIGGSSTDLMILPLEGERRLFPLLKTPFDENEARFSPDGKWVAYQCNESDRREIYVIPFNPPTDDPNSTKDPVRHGKWQVSSHGGTYPEWRKDGNEIYYVTLDGKLEATEITCTDAGIDVGVTRTLFNVIQPAGINSYQAAPDGDWFIVDSVNSQDSAPINLITQWEADLK